MTAEPAPFDVGGPLPTGTTVLEASAGTGKTFTIAALAARYVAEGRADLSELMLVTFGREATNELRERVRERLVVGRARAGRPGRGPVRPGRRVLALLAGGRRREVAARRARLTARAGRVRRRHHRHHPPVLPADAGRARAWPATRDPDAVFVESVDDLLAEVVDDLYVRKYADHGTGSPAFSRAEALTVARRAVYDDQARLEPVDAEPGSTADVRRRFAAAVRAEVERRKRRRRLYTYDDMLTRLRRRAGRPGAGARRGGCGPATGWCWSTSSRTPTRCSGTSCGARSTAHATLVLIGDPKQAIYAFRGADVVSYLEATEAAGRHATLDPQLAQRRRRCCARWTPCSAAPPSATRGSRCTRSRPRTGAGGCRGAAGRRPAAAPGGAPRRSCRAASGT